MLSQRNLYPRWNRNAVKRAPLFQSIAKIGSCSYLSRTRTRKDGHFFRSMSALVTPVLTHIKCLGRTNIVRIMANVGPISAGRSLADISQIKGMQIDINWPYVGKTRSPSLFLLHHLRCIVGTPIARGYDSTVSSQWLHISSYPDWIILAVMVAYHHNKHMFSLQFCHNLLCTHCTLCHDHKQRPFRSKIGIL
jgi:hypothetical protein